MEGYGKAGVDFNAIFASLCVRTLHPLEVVQMRFQSHSGTKQKNIVPKYKSMSDALRTIFKEEGIRGIYKGLLLTTFANAAFFGIFFTLYNNNKLLYTKYFSSMDANNLISAFQASFISKLILQPVWTVRTRVMLNVQTFNTFGFSIFNAIREIYNHHGVKGYYRGLTPSLGLSFHKSIHMTLYERILILFEYSKFLSSKEALKSSIAGILGKIIASTIVYPLTTVRLRMEQNQYASEGSGIKYTSTMHCIKKTWEGEGGSGFYKGYVPFMTRSLPSQGIFFFFYKYFN